MSPTRNQPLVQRPPQLSGDPKADAAAMQLWMDGLFRTLEAGQAQRIAGLQSLTQTIGDPPTKAQVEAVQEQLNRLLEALQG